MKRKLLPLFLGLLLVSYLSLSLFAKPAKAACPSIWQLDFGGTAGCIASEWVRETITTTAQENINTWISDAITSGLNSVLSVLTGCSSLTALGASQKYWAAGQEPPPKATATAPDGTSIEMVLCRSPGSAPVTAQGITPTGGALGSLHLAFNGMQESQPLNLALYVDQIKRGSPLPLVQSTAYANNGGEFLIPDFLGDVFQNTVLSIWTVIRDIAYAAAVVVLVVMGFMIMFRYRGRAREAFNITQAIPRIAVGLLLITFSYPIGALSIQLIHVLIAIATSALGALALGGVGELMLTNAVAQIGLLFPPTTLITLFGMIVSLLIIVAFILLLFSIFLTTISRYVKLIIMTLAAPFVFLLGMLPGQDDVIKTWFKGWLANTLAIPAIFTMMFLAGAILNMSSATATLEWGVSEIAALFASRLFTVVLAFGVLWKARSAPKAIDNMLQAESWAGIKKKLK